MYVNCHCIKRLLQYITRLHPHQRDPYQSSHPHQRDPLSVLTPSPTRPTCQSSYPYQRDPCQSSHPYKRDQPVRPHTLTNATSLPALTPSPTRIQIKIAWIMKISTLAGTKIKRNKYQQIRWWFRNRDNQHWRIQNPVTSPSLIPH